METLLETLNDAIDTLAQYRDELTANPAKASDPRFVELVRNEGYRLGAVDAE